MGRVSGSGGWSGARGVAAEELRRHNLAAVLEHLHLHGAATRSQLTMITGLNRSTVADLIGQLANLGLVIEEPGAPVSGPGRPSPVVRLRPEGAFVLVAEVSVDSIAAATVGIGGQVLQQTRIARPRGYVDPKTTVRDIAELARPLLDVQPDEHRLVGVGAAVVGIVRRSDGFVHLAPNLGWRDLPLGEVLEDALQLGVPVRVANDADLGALGEHRRGGLGGVGHLVFISGEVGIGCGVINDGELLPGAAGYAGEAGHMLVNPGGLPCKCGATGCWETEVGENSLLRRVEAVESASGLAAIDEVVRLAQSGDPATLGAISETGKWLGIGISNLINILNPEVVVLGGLFHRLFDFLEASAVEGARRALGASYAMAEIRRSAIGLDAPLIGAAEMALAELIYDPARVAATLASSR